MKETHKFYMSCKELYNDAEEIKKNLVIANKKAKRFMRMNFKKAAKKEELYRKEYDKIFESVEEINKLVKEIDRYAFTKLQHELNGVRKLTSEIIMSITNRYNDFNNTMSREATKKSRKVLKK